MGARFACNGSLQAKSYIRYEKNACSHQQTVRYGGRRRKCVDCQRTWRIRRKRQGRKRKRQTATFAEQILRSQATLRGTAAARETNRELILGRFHRSLGRWKRTHPGAPPFGRRHGTLIVIVDGVWFTLEGRRLTAFVILVRPVRSSLARLRGLVLLEGEECERSWRAVFHERLTEHEMARIRAIVADGSHGLTTIAKEHGWVYQRCHFHLIKDLRLIRGKRKSPTRWIRERAYDLVRAALDTPSERKTARLVTNLRRLIARSDCPRTVRRKVGGFLRHLKKFRACYYHPELNLPHTSNSTECVARLIQARLSPMRGVRTIASLAEWLEIVCRSSPTIRCNPKNINQIKTS